MAKFAGIIRKVDEVGRLALPVDTRQHLGIEEGDCIEILVDKEKSQIILQKETLQCLKCKSTDNLKKIKPGCHICEQCLKALVR